MGALTDHEVRPPQLLTQSHILSGFCCGQGDLDAWLAQHAMPNQRSGASRTYVVTTSSDVVVGFYSLAPTALEIHLAIGPIRRNAPSVVPMFLLGRLAVDTTWQGNGIASSMVRDALQIYEKPERLVTTPFAKADIQSTLCLVTPTSKRATPLLQRTAGVIMRMVGESR